MPGAPLGTSARDCVENECNWSASVTGYWCFTVVPWSANSISRPIARPRSSDGSWNSATNETHVKDVAGQTVRYVAGLDKAIHTGPIVIPENTYKTLGGFVTGNLESMDMLSVIVPREHEVQKFAFKNSEER